MLIYFLIPRKINKSLKEHKLNFDKTIFFINKLLFFRGYINQNISFIKKCNFYTFKFI
jgi:hypothetical protein